MPYKVTLTGTKDYLTFTVEGIQTHGRIRQDTIDVMNRVVDECIARGMRRILIHWYVKGCIPTIDAYTLASNPRQLFRWDRGYSLAAIHYDKESYLSNKFTETVAINRGFNFRVFDNVQEGIAWLTDNPIPSKHREAGFKPDIN